MILGTPALERSVMRAFYWQTRELVPGGGEDRYIFPWSQCEGAWVLCQEGNNRGLDGT